MPAINEVKKLNVSHKVHEYSHDDASESYDLALSNGV
jgi:hypothetical protein